MMIYNFCFYKVQGAAKYVGRCFV